MPDVIPGGPSPRLKDGALLPQGSWHRLCYSDLSAFSFSFGDLAVEASINWTSRDVGVEITVTN